MFDFPLLPILGLAVCLVLLLRMALGDRRRERFDAAWLGAWISLRDGVRGTWRRRGLRNQAEREADALIDRARRTKPPVRREGNVYRPRSFNGPGKGRSEGDADDGSGSDRDGRHRRDH